jgi:predicted nuclease of predicted toxin-antitoxin system
LRQEGWDVVEVWEELSPRASDSEILELAWREERAVLTQDLDFSALLALSNHPGPSLLTLRLSVTDPELVARKILSVGSTLERRLEEGCAITLEDETVRFRKLPLRPPKP